MTLTEMLVNCNTHFELDQIDAAKEEFKEWLKTVALPDYGNPTVVRTLLVVLVDEP